MGKGSKMRAANGVVSALIVAFFLAHGVLGCVALLTGHMSPFAWVVWIGVALIGLHVVLSVATSYEQLADVERPASARKKRHLALKWLTGGLLALLACMHFAHVQLPSPFGASPAMLNAVLIALLSIALAVHICVGARSLLKDVGLDRSLKGVFRTAVCVFAAFFVVAVFISVLR